MMHGGSSADDSAEVGSATETHPAGHAGIGIGPELLGSRQYQMQLNRSREGCSAPGCGSGCAPPRCRPLPKSPHSIEPQPPCPPYLQGQVQAVLPPEQGTAQCQEGQRSQDGGPEGRHKCGQNLLGHARDKGEAVHIAKSPLHTTNVYWQDGSEQAPSCSRDGEG